MTIPLDGLRALSNRYLPDTCTIQRATETSTGDGTSSSWADHATNVSCRVSPAGGAGNESLGGTGGIEAVNQWTIWLPYGTDVTVKDRIVFGSRTFEVARVGDRSYETVREVICREVT